MPLPVRLFLRPMRVSEILRLRAAGRRSNAQLIVATRIGWLTPLADTSRTSVVATSPASASTSDEATISPPPATALTRAATCTPIPE